MKDPKDKKGTFHTDESNSEFDPAKAQSSAVPEPESTDTEDHDDEFDEDDFDDESEVFEK